jgi:hypothetical protein
MSDYLGEALMSRALKLGEIGVAAVAWRRMDILDVLVQLESARVAILGGDVFEVISGRPLHTYDNWSVSSKDSSLSWLDFVGQSIERSRRYVRSYDESGRDIFYSVVAVDVDEYGKRRT